MYMSSWQLWFLSGPGGKTIHFYVTEERPFIFMSQYQWTSTTAICQAQRHFVHFAWDLSISDFSCPDYGWIEIQASKMMHWELISAQKNRPPLQPLPQMKAFWPQMEVNFSNANSFLLLLLLRSLYILSVLRFAYYCGFYFTPFRPSNSDFGYIVEGESTAR
jgi:hypothetical protein